MFLIIFATDTLTGKEVDDFVKGYTNPKFDIIRQNLASPRL